MNPREPAAAARRPLRIKGTSKEGGLRGRGPRGLRGGRRSGWLVSGVVLHVDVEVTVDILIITILIAIQITILMITMIIITVTRAVRNHTGRLLVTC